MESLKRWGEPKTKTKEKIYYRITGEHKMVGKTQH